MDRLAHDLRGPLAPMLTAIYLLRDGVTQGRQRDDLLVLMERQVQRLASMVDELSDIGRAEKGRLVGRMEPIDLELLLGEVAAPLHAVAPEISFAPGTRGSRIQGDVLRIGQLFRTLLGLQFSRHHPVAVRAQLARAGADLRMTCRVHCRDAATLPVSALLSLPHPEPQDDSLGLGLMIAAAIAQAHGGSLRGGATGADTIELVLQLPEYPAADPSPDPVQVAGDPGAPLPS
jgi:signal transduction histidine kinase